MSNRASIYRTVFVDYHDKSETYGYRIGDDYASVYNNCMSKEEIAETDDEKFLRNILGYLDGDAAGIFDAALDKGVISIDDTYYKLGRTDDGWEMSPL